MSRILPSIGTLVQHLFSLANQPALYRPASCPHCGKEGLWNHGYYHRKADREQRKEERLDPVPIPRYYCKSCARTCSRLPSCIAPHRWYSWAVQQSVIVLLLKGFSFYKAAKCCQPGRRTISRWWHRLEEQFVEHGFHLRNRFPELGRHADFASFWSACFEQMPLADAMAWLDRDGVVVP
jgi:transposase-like protein